MMVAWARGQLCREVTWSQDTKELLLLQLADALAMEC